MRLLLISDTHGKLGNINGLASNADELVIKASAGGGLTNGN